MKSFKPVVFYNQVKETITTSLVVLVVVGLITAYLGVVDFIVSKLAQQVIG